MCGATVSPVSSAPLCKVMATLGRAWAGGPQGLVHIPAPQGLRRIKAALLTFPVLPVEWGPCKAFLNSFS